MISDDEESIDLTPGDVWSDVQMAIVGHLLGRMYRAESALRRVREVAVDMHEVIDAGDASGSLYESAAASLRHALAGDQ